MKRLLIIPLALILLLLAACAGTAPDTAANSGAQEITLIARDLEFEPNTIEVTAGRRVALTLRNEGVLEHDFSIMHIQADDVDEHSHGSDSHEVHMAAREEPDLHVAAIGGETGTLKFTLLEAGTYEFYCAVPGHKEAGMTGTLIVRSP
jgi:uncharacterized cupredoxin-like copper-binding protein